ncbi:helix-turn-helix domain-containing protein [Chryseobacterium sp. MIQD13]|uniref:helix-turn-helix domain-containing protein n=1 Tax=Chryseobacterium sp. MIQD13 TaxID=3422310 RepID=UPI003D2A12AD
MEKIIKMNKLQNINRPNYRKIYIDLINEKYPEKKHLLDTLKDEQWLAIDVIKINDRLFNHQDKQKNTLSQKHRSYDKQTIFRILDYQKKNKLNNVQLARVFNISRNSVAKWKKLFLI